MAENIIEDFKDFADPGTYRKIINNINEALEKEFLELASEADDLFGTKEEEEPPDAALSKEEH
ncbi:unnamed protein product [marine sediment metagenome]|uniref:Uncharacterized protein n=1 Tax=marine sediment metagenome TaxID=412755 RepID=X0ZQ65_9ZZZZ